MAKETKQLDFIVEAGKRVGLKMGEKGDMFFVIELPMSSKFKIVNFFYSLDVANQFISIANDQIEEKKVG